MRTTWLIRHGESTSNAGGACESPQAIPLSEKGRQQARDLAECFPYKPELIVYSPYLRTRETAEPLMQRFPDVPVVEWPMHEFTFLDVERFRGTTEAHRAGRVREFWESCEPDYNDGNGAESFNDFMLRVRSFQDRLRTAPQQFIAAFTHGYVIKAMVWETIYCGEVGVPEFMRGYRSLHFNLPVHNGVVVPLHFGSDGRPFVGSMWNHPYPSPAPAMV